MGQLAAHDVLRRQRLRSVCLHIGHLALPCRHRLFQVLWRCRMGLVSGSLKFCRCWQPPQLFPHQLPHGQGCRWIARPGCPCLVLGQELCDLCCLELGTLNMCSFTRPVPLFHLRWQPSLWVRALTMRAPLIGQTLVRLGLNSWKIVTMPALCLRWIQPLGIMLSRPRDIRNCLGGFLSFCVGNCRYRVGG